MIATILVAALGALHVYILALEMFWWESPRTRAAFGTSPELAKVTRVMAGNQGLYNGFLAAGFFWALWLGLAGEGSKVALFFAGCVLVAGVYGAATVSRRILMVQALPATLTILALWLGW